MSRCPPGPAGLGPDDDMAAEQERSAGRALARGPAAAAAFLERAAALTPGRGARARRALAAAQAPEQAGAPQSALAVLAMLPTWPLDELQRAMLERPRERLSTAYTMLPDMGARAFARRARRELLTTSMTSDQVVWPGPP